MGGIFFWAAAGRFDGLVDLVGGGALVVRAEVRGIRGRGAIGRSQRNTDPLTRASRSLCYWSCGHLALFAVFGAVLALRGGIWFVAHRLSFLCELRVGAMGFGWWR